MGYLPWCFLGSHTVFGTGESYDEGTSDGADVSEVVATGKIRSSSSGGDTTYTTTFFFTTDPTRPGARYILGGEQYFWPDLNDRVGQWVGATTWNNPAGTPQSLGWDDTTTLQDDIFVIGAGWNPFMGRVGGADGVVNKGSNIVSSASAKFSPADIGSQIISDPDLIPVNTVIEQVNTSTNTATISANCTGTSTTAQFIVGGQAQGRSDIGAAYGYNYQEIPGLVSAGWHDSMITIWAPPVTEVPKAGNFGIAGWRQRCSDMTGSQPWVATGNWGWPHADFDRTFAVIMGESPQYGWGVSLVNFLWHPTTPVTPPPPPPPPRGCSPLPGLVRRSRRTS